MNAEAMLANPGSTERTRVRRIPELAVTDRSMLHRVLDAGLVGHLALADETGQPYALPVAYARDDESLIVHGSTASRLFRLCAAGTPVCLTVTLLDGLVLARSAFESSMNYRSVMVLGHCSVLHGKAKERGLRLISDHLMPERWNEVRKPSAQELKATAVLELPLDECSVKINADGPDDPAEDVELPVWAGRVPLIRQWGDPVPSADLKPEYGAIPEYVRRWNQRTS
ncbi:pyridoxamine 5'-phosphate oxidase family protein [Actinospica sp. MGRD01-02]|uniref:Pyridoxamine 5'-phosphate oxidase family protein n=1 Tax=Actinospica acidithermotolerans TaxID=2828514 RepID=A0A941E4C8_9ACTN|nr:pyridoxamine 5'-phosphate oxidase family protein [Actinospica acidithermotolerans]MBR7824881.1 pyridoxamine 5'-phosphate oxidase family protein [Actinospica acidithermotolerans]